MKAIPLSLAFGIASGTAFAQGAADPMAHLRACSLMEGAERLECLDKLARDIAAPDRAAGRDGGRHDVHHSEKDASRTGGDDRLRA